MVSIERELIRTYYFFTGKGQWAPRWFAVLPEWFRPIYHGDSIWHWFGIEIKANSMAGDTLLMHWQRQRRKDK